ncbi:unnamed protein product [Rhizophagus irregularis]|nr:unnamed protein product [Rhizophagus irregularis]
MNTQNTAELTAPENSSLEASIHAPASGSVSSHSPADPSSTTRAPSIVNKLTLNEARGLCARSDPQADPYGREGQVPVGNDTYLLCHVTYLVIVIEYYMSPFTIDPMMATWVSWGSLLRHN